MALAKYDELELESLADGWTQCDLNITVPLQCGLFRALIKSNVPQVTSGAPKPLHCGLFRAPIKSNDPKVTSGAPNPPRHLHCGLFRAPIKSNDSPYRLH